jgi:hypothetical protein
MIAGTAWGGAISLLVAGFLKTADSFYNWTLAQPWENPITIEGEVCNILKDEVVTVSCRNESIEIHDVNGNKRAEYWMQVSSDPMYNEKHKYGIHFCLVKVKGTKHNGEASSIPILSWAFANGSLYHVFLSPGGKKSKSKNVKFVVNEFFYKFKKWLDNRPFFNFFTRIISNKNPVEKLEEKNSDKKDFDLHALIQKAKEEEKGYEDYDVEYKKYYPGAPSDPDIVYYSSDQVIVGFKQYVDVTNMQEVEGHPVVDRLVELNTVIVEIYAIDPEDFILLVEQNPDVEYAELNYVYEKCFEPNDPLWDMQWGPKAIKCPQAWDLEKGNSGFVNAAILDTGCNIDHEDIPDTISYLDYDYVNDDDDPSDDCYVNHGTHCAGIFGATMNNEKGITGISKVFLNYGKVLDSEGLGTSSNIAKGIVDMAKSGMVNVISMSLGGYGISLLMHIACDYAYYIKNTLIVAAAGNDGLIRLCYPARFGSVISVGAVDKNLNLCSWSNWGPNLDIVAPGEDIISTVGTSNYIKLSGTSMATPHVAAVASLYFCRNPNKSAALCKAKLFSTAMPIQNGGHGLVNAFDMVKSKTRSFDFQQILYRFPILHFFYKIDK